jgi:hypothetical protein
MFKKDTVVVVGAGASFEAGLPLGLELKASIAKLTRFKPNMWGDIEHGDHEFYRELRRIPEFKESQQRLIEACTKISKGISFISSIDSFLEIHGADADIKACAKTAIAKLILEAEAKSKLVIDPSNIYNQLEPGRLDRTWYQELVHILFEKVDPVNLEKAFEPVEFIIFNYDRCIEWLIFHAIQGLYFCDKATAAKLIREKKFLHPFGDVGRPSWIDSRGVGFGENTSGRLAIVGEGIRTFTERAQSDGCLEQITDAISNAETIVFLGLSFHPECLDILRPHKGKSRVERIFGTSLMMSPHDKIATERFLANLYSRRSDKPEAILADLPCHEFLKQYKRSLAA